MHIIIIPIAIPGGNTSVVDIESVSIDANADLSTTLEVAYTYGDERVPSTGILRFELVLEYRWFRENDVDNHWPKGFPSGDAFLEKEVRTVDGIPLNPWILWEIEESDQLNAGGWTVVSLAPDCEGLDAKSGRCRSRYFFLPFSGYGSFHVVAQRLTILSR